MRKGREVPGMMIEDRAKEVDQGDKPVSAPALKEK
jgi:hypothetical protein